MDIIKQFVAYRKKLIECKIFVANIDRLVVYTSKLLDNHYFGFWILDCGLRPIGAIRAYAPEGF